MGRETYAEFNNERYNVQNTPHVLWNGTRYAKGMKRKLINYQGEGVSTTQKLLKGAYLGEWPYLPIGNDSFSVKVFKFSTDVLNVAPLH